MHALLFAGGFGQRLWPISRKNKPKQFTALFGDKSFLRLSVERLFPLIPADHIFISTNERFVDIISEQLPEIPRGNLILEPDKRDLAAAAGLAFFTLSKLNVTGPIYFQWSDNYVGNEDGLRRAISVGHELIKHNTDQIVFIGQTPRFASENLGWIEHGEVHGNIGDTPYYNFKSWHYRPKPETCQKMFESGCYSWNSGFFVTTMEFMISTFRKVAPDLSEIADEIVSLGDGPDSLQQFRALYNKMPVQHFDEAFLMKLTPEQAVILKIDLNWTDPGTLYSLKEALSRTQEETVKQNTGGGSIIDVDCSDSLLLNEENKVVCTMGMEGVVVINTKDVVLVISKDSVRHMAKLLNELKLQGFEHLL